MRIYLFILFSLLLFSNTFAQIRATYAPRIIEQNGKFGIIDENGITAVLPVYDTVISTIPDFEKLNLRRVNPVFILKKENKYAFAYCINLDSLKEMSQIPQTPWSWYISDVIYDNIETYGFTVAGVQSALTGFFVLKYKLDGKWGLIYIPGRNTVLADNFLVSVGKPSVLGNIRMTEAKYDSILDPHILDGLFNVLLNGKWGLVEVISTHPDEVYNKGHSGFKEWRTQFYEGNWDTISIHTSSYFKEIEANYYRKVQKNGKWGLIKIQTDTKSIEYLIPCVNESHNEIHSTYPIGVFYSTIKGEKDTVFFADTKTNINHKFPISLEEGWRVTVNPIEFDTLPDKTTDKLHKRYVMIELRDTNDICKEMYILDESKNIKASFNKEDTEYKHYVSSLGVLISSKKNIGMQNLFELFCLEKGKSLFSIKVNKNVSIDAYQTGTDYLFRKAFIENDGTYYHSYNNCILQMYLVFVASETGKKDKVIGYYNFLSKKFYKKKPPKINGRC